MTRSEIEAALKAAFNQCEAASYPLSDRQKQILLQALWEAVQQFEGHDRTEASTNTRNVADKFGNPLDDLAPEERLAFLAFVKEQERQNQPWKIALLNDWLEGRSSGSVQFVRERYGIQWLEQITPGHLARYDLEGNDVLKLKVGDRIEVTNGLWEWVQETGPCSREWFSCTVIRVQDEPRESDFDLDVHDLPVETKHSSATSCVIRFDSGAEYEIQGVYDWNRPNWRWLEP